MLSETQPVCNNTNSKNVPRATKNNVWHDFRDWKIVLLLQATTRLLFKFWLQCRSQTICLPEQCTKSTFQITMKALHSWCWLENLFHSSRARQCFSSGRRCTKKCTKCYTHKLKQCISLVGFIHVTGPMLLAQDFSFLLTKAFKADQCKCYPWHDWISVHRTQTNHLFIHRFVHILKTFKDFLPSDSILNFAL